MHPLRDAHRQAALRRRQRSSGSSRRCCSDNPKWGALPAGCAAPVRRLLRRCLQKDQRLRLRHAGDLRLELLDIGDTDRCDLLQVLEAAAYDRRDQCRDRRGCRRPRLSTACWPLLVVPASSGPRRTVPSASGSSCRSRGDEDVRPRLNVPAISPDGRRVAYTDGQRLRIRDLTTFETRDVQVAGVAGLPSWSPDGALVAFFTDHKWLWKVPKEGGAATKICDLPPGVVFGIAWRPDRTIVIDMASRTRVRPAVQRARRRRTSRAGDGSRCAAEDRQPCSTCAAFPMAV